MFKNNNRGTIRELGMDNYHAHRGRNVIAVLAIALTTILITAVLTVGISFTSTILNYGESAPGPGGQGSVSVTWEQCQELKELPQVEWADYILKCSSSPLRNDAFAGMEVWLLAPEQSYYKHNHVDLLEGHYPENGNEIIISDTMAERFGIENPVGKELTLKMMIQQEDAPKEEELTFTICGYFKNPLVSLVDIYDEIFTSQEFLHQSNPQLEHLPGEAYVNLNNLNPLLMKSDVIDKLAKVNEAVGGDGMTTKHSSSFAELLLGVIPALLFVAFIILSGYFLIYNVFYISVASDIRWFGMMKTLGTTPRQLKQILMVQIWRLAVMGICIGVVVGYFIGNRLAPRVVAYTIFGQFYKAPDMLLIFLLGAGFAWLTVYISARKSMKIASSISPVEAARYVPKKKRNLFTVLSLSLSGIIFMVACNVTLGYDVDKMVNRYNMQDGRIWHKASLWGSGKETYQSLDKELAEDIRSLPYVTKVDEVYQARSLPDFVEWEGNPYYLDSLARVKPSGGLKEWLDTISNSPEYTAAYQNTVDQTYMDNGDIRLNIMGLPAERLRSNMPYLNVLEGELDQKKFATGNYILWQDIQQAELLEGSNSEEKKIHVGDALTLELYNNITESYIEKQVTVLAVVEKIDMFGTSDIGYSNIVMSDTAFQEAYPDYEKWIAAIQIETEGEITKEQNQEINTLIAQYHNTQLTMESRYLTRESQEDSEYTIKLIGIFLSLLLGIIGISNVVNTITSDVFARKIELAALQSMGMTKKQLWRMLFLDAMKFSLTALTFILFWGGFLSTLVAVHPLFTGFSIPLFIFAGTMMIVVVMGVDMLVATILVKTLNKKSIVERLREVE